MHPSRRLNRSRTLLLVAALCAATGSLQAGDATLVQVPAGRGTISLEIAADEFEIQGLPGAARTATADPSTDLQARRAVVRVSEGADIQTTVHGWARSPGVEEVRAVGYLAGRPRTTSSRRVITRDIAFSLRPGADAIRIAERHGGLRPDSAIPGIWVTRVSATAPGAALAVGAALAADPEVAWAEVQLAAKADHRFIPADPLFGAQWHLRNTVEPGEDLRVEAAWNTATGAGVLIAITDDGIQATHPDLASRVRTDLGIDINDGDADPSPGPGDDHGTVVAGCAAAANNGIGGVGSAFGARLVGIRLIAGPTTPSEDAQAMMHLVAPASAGDRVWINSNSWGIPDDGQELPERSPVFDAAIEHGIEYGRGGLGTVYVWACGNGRDEFDTADHDANLTHQVIPVGAVNRAGRVTWYSERGGNVHVVAPGGQSPAEGLITADRTGADGYNAAGDYTGATDGIQGTSFSAPLVSGVCALVMQANPNLTWRDVQHVLAATARRNHAASPDWRTNAGGYQRHPDYGFGCVRADLAVNLARRWSMVPELAPVIDLPAPGLPRLIPDSPLAGVSLDYAATPPAGFRVETVDLDLNLLHDFRGDLSLTVTSPAGTVHRIAGRPLDGGTDMRFTVAGLRTFWGEAASGTWRVTISDEVDGYSGIALGATLRLRGFQLPQAPAIVSVSPDRSAGAGDMQITVTGSGYVQNQAGITVTRIVVDGTPLATVPSGPSSLSATIPAALVEAATGAMSVVLVNAPLVLGSWDGVSALPLHGGGTSAALAIQRNRMPVMSAGGRAVVMDEDGAPVPFSSSISATDPDGDTLTWSLATPAGHGTASAGGSGTTPVLVYSPDPDWNGVDAFAVRAIDAFGGSTTAVITVTVSAVNDAPDFIGGAPVRARPGQDREHAYWATRMTPGGGDDESGQSLAFSVTGSHPGVFDIAPEVDGDGILRYRVAAGAAAGSYGFTVVVTDDGGAASVGRPLTIHVDPGTDTTPPAAPTNLVITSVPATGASPVFTGSAAPGLGVVLIIDGQAVASGTTAGDGQWTLAVSEPLADGLHHAEAVAVDGDGDASVPSQVLPFWVGNRPPVFTGVGPVLAGMEDATASAVVTATDADGHGLSWSVLTAPAHGSLAITATGGSAQVVLTPEPGWSGSDQTVIRVMDVLGASATRAVAITIVPVDDPPTIGAITDRTMNEDGVIVVPVAVSDEDTPVGMLTVTASCAHPALLPDAGLVVSGAGTVRTMVVTPAADAFGTTDVTLTVGDGSSIRTTTFRVVVFPVNDPPLNLSLPGLPATAQPGVILAHVPGSWSEARDGGGGGLIRLTVQWQRESGSGFVAIAGATAATYVPGLEDLGRSIRIVETATDGLGASATAASVPASVLSVPGLRCWVVLTDVAGRGWTVLDPEGLAPARSNGSTRFGPADPGEPIILILPPSGSH
jgi:subtilisin family serine protease